ncbi:hypothetical protein FA13DRAFT_1581416, partial [Coprinellus micaceus]
YNKAVVYSMRDEAILAMEDKGIILSTRDVNKALAIMPKVSGLARRVHDSAVLKERFDNLVAGDPTQNGMKHSLDR